MNTVIRNDLVLKLERHLGPAGVRRFLLDLTGEDSNTYVLAKRYDVSLFLVRLARECQDTITHHILAREQEGREKPAPTIRQSPDHLTQTTPRRST